MVTRYFISRFVAACMSSAFLFGFEKTSFAFVLRCCVNSSGVFFCDKESQLWFYVILIFHSAIEVVCFGPILGCMAIAWWHCHLFHAYDIKLECDLLNQVQV